MGNRYCMNDVLYDYHPVSYNLMFEYDGTLHFGVPCGILAAARDGKFELRYILMWYQ